MSSRKTSKLNLHAWDAKDAFRRDEFNENFEAIDKNAEATWAEVMKKADADTVSALQSAVEGNNAAMTEKVEIKCGFYTGNNEATRVIDLGFTPKAVYLCTHYAATVSQSGTITTIYGGLALPEHPIRSADTPALEITDGGFQVGYSQGRIHTNYNTVNYHYIAFK